MRSHRHLSPNEQTEEKGLCDPGYSRSRVQCNDLWFLSLRTLEAAEHEKSENSSKMRERQDLVAEHPSQTLKHYSESCPQYASLRPLQTKRVILSRLFPHAAGAKGLICNHQRNADRLETGLHSIILIRIQDLFWRSCLGSFLPAPPTSNEAIGMHGTSKADMKSDSLQTYISDSVAWVLNFNVCLIQGGWKTWLSASLHSLTWWCRRNSTSGARAEQMTWGSRKGGVGMSNLCMSDAVW